ncbi:hypothetical protein N9L68_03850 [bacterium]|nr:hypothetical protein [bacterium]
MSPDKCRPGSSQASKTAPPQGKPRHANCVPQAPHAHGAPEAPYGSARESLRFPPGLASKTAAPQNLETMLRRKLLLLHAKL